MSVIISEQTIFEKMNQNITRAEFNLCFDDIQRRFQKQNMFLSIATRQFCETCDFPKSNDIVLPFGNLSSDLMLIGKMPSELEYETHCTHLEEAGAIAERILSALNYPKEKVYFTNIVKCYSQKMNADICKHCAITYLSREIEIVSPKIVICESLAILKYLYNYDMINTTKEVEYFTKYQYKDTQIPVVSIYDLDSLSKLNPQEFDRYYQEIIKNLSQII